MYALLHKTHDVSVIHDLVKTENRGHGYSFITGASGESIAKRWGIFIESCGVKQ